MSLADVIKVAEENLNADSPNISALQLDAKELQELSSLLSSKTSEMSIIGSSGNEQDASLTEDINRILGKSRSQIRAIKLKLQECQHPNQMVNTTDSSIQHVVPPSSPENAFVTLDEENSSATAHTLTQSHSILSTQSDSVPLFSVGSASTGNHFSNIGMSVSPPASTNQSLSEPPPTFTNPFLQVHQHSPVSSGPSSVTSPALSTSVQNTVPPLPMSTHHIQSVYGPSNPLLYPPIPTLHTPHINNTSTGPQPTPLPISNHPMYYGANAHGNNFLPPSSVQLRKMDLPTFSGDRRDWPKFKTVWKSVAESALHNKTALAHELKRSVKAEASKRIKS